MSPQYAFTWQSIALTNITMIKDLQNFSLSPSFADYCLLQVFSGHPMDRQEGGNAKSDARSSRARMNCSRP
ncbi:MAG: hypothetical protein NT065_03890 [Chlamydiae bacterium]|nr:hypothetical protein [Chlamydiota bacterium]